MCVGLLNYFLPFTWVLNPLGAWVYSGTYGILDTIEILTLW